MPALRILIGCITAGALALAPSDPVAAARHSAHGTAHGHGSTHGARHGSTHGATHGKSHGTRDRLAGPRNAAGHVLRAQEARLNRMLAAVGVREAWNADDQAALLAALQ